MKDLIKIVMIGHVDHGKSTLLGRLLVDSGKADKDKITAIDNRCKSEGRDFEYAYLLDALKDERAQGITIDAARCFFSSQQKDYIIFDAPGHIEFIRNMITGASKADAAFILVDAGEGIMENTKRHGFITSMLGISQVSVVINKIDLVSDPQKTYNEIVSKYSKFLEGIGVKPLSFIPVSAKNGINVFHKDQQHRLPWYSGGTVMEQLESFKTAIHNKDAVLRFVVQDIYKFDSRRITSGYITSGTVKNGEKLKFFPSGKESRIKEIRSIDDVEVPSQTAGELTGLILEDQLYLSPGEIGVVAATDEQTQPSTSFRFNATVFLFSKEPLVKEKYYKIRIGTGENTVKIASVNRVIDSSTLKETLSKDLVEKYDIAEVDFEAVKPVSFDKSSFLTETSRFVIMDNYQIAACATVNSVDVSKGESCSKSGGSLVSLTQRVKKNHHQPKFILFTASEKYYISEVAALLEKELFESNFNAFYFGIDSILCGLDSDIASIESAKKTQRGEIVRRLGELSNIITGSGTIFITVLENPTNNEVELLKKLNSRSQMIVIDDSTSQDIDPNHITLKIDESKGPVENVERVIGSLVKNSVLPQYHTEYYI